METKRMIQPSISFLQHFLFCSVDKTKINLSSLLITTERLPFIYPLSSFKSLKVSYTIINENL